MTVQRKAKADWKEGEKRNEESEKKIRVGFGVTDISLDGDCLGLHVSRRI